VPPPHGRPHPRRLAITTENATFQVLESLVANRTKRHRAGTLLVEGVLPLSRALDHGWTFDATIQSRGAVLSDWARDFVERAAPAHVYEMAPGLMARLTGRADGSELLAVVRMADASLERIRVTDALLVVVVDRPGNPGNLGTIVRSADALGASGVIVTGHAADIYEPATVTASRGSLFAIPVVTCESHSAVLDWLEAARARLGRCQLVGADEGAGTPLDAHDFECPTLLVLGNETHGLSRAWREACDALVSIPMSGRASSLNVAVAASIALYEVARQRRTGLATRGQ
jgi:tRNA G18 (ribose-2'-O)-methylase SpoU